MGSFRLTEHKRRIVELIADGYSNAEIARQLHLEEDTIKSHVRMLMQATGTRNRTHLVVYMIRNGHVTVPVMVQSAASNS